MDLSVVIPVYNEAENVQSLAHEIYNVLKALPQIHEIIFVNDGSRDDTLKKLQESMRDIPTLRVLNLEKNSGQSAALHAGIMASRGKMIVNLDGDAQNDPADIPKLLAELKNADLVCGWRVGRKDTGARKIASRIANNIRNFYTHDGVRDTGCSLKAFHADVRRAFVPFNGMHRFMPALAKIYGYRICEVPVNHRPRLAGVSKYSIGGRAWRGIYDLIGICWLKRRLVNYRVQSDVKEN